jgi:hypothetical protein
VIKKLFADTEVLFRKLQEATDARSDLRVFAYDYVARAGRNCIVDFGNASKNWTLCQDLLQQCRTVAASPDLIKRIDEDLSEVQSNLRLRQTGVNFTIPGPQPNRTHAPSAATESPGTTGSGGTIAKILAVIIAIVGFVTIVKSCNTSSGTAATHTTPAPEPTPVDNSPPPPAISQHSREVPNGTPTIRSDTGNTQSEKRSRVQALKLEIKSGRSQLHQLESSLRECDQTLSNYSQLIRDDRQRLDKMKSDNDAGVYVDATEYERACKAQPKRRSTQHRAS